MPCSGISSLAAKSRWQALSVDQGGYQIVLETVVSEWGWNNRRLDGFLKFFFLFCFFLFLFFSNNKELIALQCSSKLPV